MPWGRSHSFPAASTSSCNMGTFEAVVSDVNETDLKLKPSKRIRPLSVPIQRYPSAVCPIVLTAPPGNLLALIHSSRTYCDGKRLGSTPRASWTRHSSTIPKGIHRIGFNEKITEDTRICQLPPRFHFSVGSGPDGIHIKRYAPIRHPGKGLPR